MASKITEKLLRKLAFVQPSAYRVPLAVKAIRVRESGDSYPICPRCGNTMDREYMRFCDRCGQRLCWMLLDIATVVTQSSQRR